MKHFSIGIIWRLGILSLFLAGIIYFLMQKQWAGVVILSVFAGMMFYSIFTYVTSINRKLARFFESVRYADFTVKFRADNKLGKSFEDVNQQLNGVLDAFRQARAEKEANLHYINTIVQHVNVGLLSFDSSGNIELINNNGYEPFLFPLCLKKLFFLQVQMGI